VTTRDIHATRRAGDELRALQACRHLEETYGIRSAVPAYDPADGGYTGAVTIDPNELLYALAVAAEGEW
jgi:hypothetical protein